MINHGLGTLLYVMLVEAMLGSLLVPLMTPTKRIEVMRRILVKMRAIRTRLDPLVLAPAKRPAAASPANARHAKALRYLAARSAGVRLGEKKPIARRHFLSQRITPVVHRADWQTASPELTLAAAGIFGQASRAGLLFRREKGDLSRLALYGTVFIPPTGPTT